MAIHSNSRPPILGYGRDANGVSHPIHVDTVGQVTGTNAGATVVAEGSHTAKLLYGRTAGGVSVPIAVSGTGFILFA